MHLAVAGLHADAVEALLDYRADANAIDAMGRTPLYLAAERVHKNPDECERLARALLRAGADDRVKLGPAHLSAFDFQPEWKAMLEMLTLEENTPKPEPDQPSIARPWGLRL